MPPGSVLDIFLAIFAIFYSLVVLSLIVGLVRLQRQKTHGTPFVSVIVAARNEDKNLERLLAQLAVQTYPAYEVLVINDRSTDKTGEIISTFEKRFPHIKRIDISSIDPRMPAKKNALATGILKSQGEILCFTDADCLPMTTWIAELVSLFTPSVGLVAGYSPYDESWLPDGTPHSSHLKTLFYRFIAYEELKGAAWAAGSIGLGKAWLCTGRNLAYRRAAYDQVGGFEKIRYSVSGDDDLFLLLVRRETDWDIRYTTAPEGFVRTIPPRTFAEFVRQRRRHFSAGKYFPAGMKIFFPLFHLANLSLLASALAFLFTAGDYFLGLFAFGVKVFVDLGLFFTAARRFNEWKFSSSFLLMEILYIFYNTLIGPLGFISRFEWKPESE